MGREGSAQGRPRAALAAPHDQGQSLRRLLHLQEHGAGFDLPHHGTEVSHRRPELSHPGAPAQPLHPLLLLHPRRSARADGDPGSLVLSVPDHLLPQWPQLHRTGTHPCADRLPQERQCVSRGDVAALQAAADRLSADIIRQRLDYWTFLLGPKFSARERKAINLSRFYAIAQIEYCRNFIFKRHFPIHKLFERSCELGLWRLTADKMAAIFGTRL